MLLVDDLAAGGTKNLRHTPRGLVTLFQDYHWKELLYNIVFLQRRYSLTFSKFPLFFSTQGGCTYNKRFIENRLMGKHKLNYNKTQKFIEIIKVCFEGSRKCGAINGSIARHFGRILLSALFIL